MKRLGVAVVAWLLVAASSLRAQAVPLTPSEDKGTYLGVLFSPVTEALYDQLPQLPRNQGVLITHILPDSPGAHADLHRHDILLRYQDEKIRDCEHLARMIRDDKPNRKVKLSLLRGGKEVSAEATLGLGPVMRIAPAFRASPTVPEPPRGVAKPGGPASVSVSATPLEHGKMKVAIEFYQDGTGRLRTVTCQGSYTEIESEVQKQLPSRERSLVQAALKRIRDLNTDKPDRSAGNEKR
jgi:hypothetical protein